MTDNNAWATATAKHYENTLAEVVGALGDLAEEVEHRGTPGTGPDSHVAAAATVLNRITNGLGNLQLGALVRAAAEADQARRSGT